MHRTCLKTFILVYTSNPDRKEFGWAIGRDSQISGYQLKDIIDTQIENLDADQMVHAIGSLISNIRITLLHNINSALTDLNSTSGQHCQYQRNESQVVDPFELFNDCEKVQIDHELRELKLQTTLGPSGCEIIGLTGYVIIAYLDGLYGFNQRMHAVQSLISNIRISAVEIMNAKFSVLRWIPLFKILFKVAVIFGFLGNVICVVAIWFTKLIKSPVNKYLVVLLISDTLFNVWIIGDSMIYAIGTWNSWGCAFTRFMFTSTMCASSNVLVLLTMERFFAIVFPLHHMQYNHMNRWTIILITLLPMQLYNIYFHLRPYMESTKALTTFNIDIKKLNNFEYKKCFHPGIFSLETIHFPFDVSLFVLPLITIIFVNIAIAIQLRRQRNGKVQSTKSPERSNETLWILPTIYVTLSTPYFILLLVEKFFLPKYPHFSIEYVSFVLQNLFLLDFVYNWLLYAMASSSFRRTFTSFWSKVFRRIRPATKSDSKKERNTLTLTKSSKSQDCQYAVNESSVTDEYGLLNDCEKVQIDYEIMELERQTMKNQSTDACEKLGIKGVVIVVKDGNAIRLANELYRDKYRLILPSCRKSLVLVYSAVPDKFGLAVGSDSPIGGDEIKAIAVKQLNGFNADQRMHSISNLISSMRIRAVEKIKARKPAQHCAIQRNRTHVADPHGLLNNCEKVQIDYELEELYRQTQINQSDNTRDCAKTGIKGHVTIVMNGSAPFLANTFYRDQILRMRPTCLKLLFLVYSFVPDQFGGYSGRDSPIDNREIKAIADKQLQNLSADQRMHSISSLISSIRIGAIENINAKLSVEQMNAPLLNQHCRYQRNESHVYDDYGLLSDCEKVQIDYELRELNRLTRIYALDQFNWDVGSDSPICGEEIKIIAGKQLQGLSADQRMHSISSLISSIRIGAIENINARNSGNYSTSGPNCRIGVNESYVVDSSGLLTAAEKEQIEHELQELEEQTRITQSAYLCEQTGIGGLVVVVKNESAVPLANEIYWRQYRRLHPVCQNSFVLVYSYATGQFGWRVGRDSPIGGDEIKIIADEQTLNWINSFRDSHQISPDQVKSARIVGTLISAIRISAVKETNKRNLVQTWMSWFKTFFRIAVIVGFFGNIVCIVTILCTKLIKTAVNKYLVVLLISDTMFNLWILSKVPRQIIENWNFWTCMLVQSTFTSPICASSNVLVLLTMERFFAIIFPLHHMQYSHINRWIITLITLLPMQLYIIYLFPLSSYIDPKSYNFYEPGRCLGKSELEFEAVNIPFHVSLFILPIFAITLVNAAIATKIGVQHKKGSVKIRSTKSNDGSNETLWILPTIYASLATPNIVLSFLKKFVYAGSMPYMTNVLHDLLFHLYMLDFVHNWFFYAMTSSTFRRTFIHFWSNMFRKIWPQLENTSSSNNNSNNSTSTKESDL
ncbi:7 transmembrane receptor (rhodopsin family) domain-containing protein [Ditylenchus destructor]|nr:7 transmembrane receptor (rhodopsin family) domain-containing protein [Ditylenchus destructor]